MDLLLYLFDSRVKAARFSEGKQIDILFNSLWDINSGKAKLTESEPLILLFSTGSFILISSFKVVKFLNK